MILVYKINVYYLDDIGNLVNYSRWTQVEWILQGVPTNWEMASLFFYNKLNKLQIKLLWVFINSDKVLGSIKNKKFVEVSNVV